jgi:integrase
VLYEGLRQHLGEVIRRLAEQKVKLKKGQRFGFHNFRHGLASWLVNQGTEIKMVQGPLAITQKRPLMISSKAATLRG